MIVADCLQNSEEWDQLRCGIPTASEFGKILSPVQLKPSASQGPYIAELIAETLPSYTKALPQYDMQNGADREPQAIAHYEFLKDIDTKKVGFIFGDESMKWGGSPDALINGGPMEFYQEDGGLEVKCPNEKTQITRLLTPEVPSEYLPQIFGYMLITGRNWWDFCSYHPDLEPVIIRVERDTEFGTKTKVSFEKWVKAFVPALHEFIEKLEQTKQKLGVS